MKPQSILLKPMLWLGTLALLAFVDCAQAMITCTPSAASFSTAYPMTGGALNITAGSFTVTCSNASPVSSTATYQVSAGLGLNLTGGLRYAITGTGTLNYNLTSDICNTVWNTTALIPTPPYTTPSLSKTGVPSDTHIIYFWGCVPAGLTVPAAGTYADSVITTVTGSASSVMFQGKTGSITVSITAPATCSLTAPGTMIFNYTSGSAIAAAASTTFNALCTNLLPYTLSLDAGGTGYTGSFTSPTGSYTNTATSLIYSLTLPTPTAGTGVAQTYTLTGSMAAGQGGKCNAGTCSVTDIHTLTVTY